MRRAIERLFRVHADWRLAYTDILGAKACTVHRCDLSHGIEVDNAHRTVTFHLTAPDPYLPAKMSSPASGPVPPGTPWHDVGYTPKAIKGWADKAHEWEGTGKKKRDVFVYMISGAKERAPAAAMALLKELK